MQPNLHLVSEKSSESSTPHVGEDASDQREGKSPDTHSDFLRCPDVDSLAVLVPQGSGNSAQQGTREDLRIACLTEPRHVAALTGLISKLHEGH